MFNSNEKGGRRRPAARPSPAASASPQRPEGSPAGTSGEVVIKLIGVGDEATGKSTFFRHWETNKVATTPARLTVSVDFHKREMNIQIPPVGFVAPSSGDATSMSSPQGSPSPMRTAVTTTTSRQSDADAPSESRSTFGFGDSNGEGSASRKDFTPSFKIVAPSPADFGPQSETIPTLIQVWDVQGQERIKNLTRIFYDSAMGALVFCDVKSAKSLEGAAQWKADIDTKVFVSVADPNAPPTAPPPTQVRSFRLSSNPSAPPPAAAKIDKKIPCWLVINKCDLLSHSDPPAPLCMTTDHLDHFVKEHGFVGWCYASGMKGVHVREAVAALLSQVVMAFPEEVRKRAHGTDTTTADSNTIRLNNNGRFKGEDEDKRRCVCKN